MPREVITIECTEARKEGKSPSRYTTTRNKKLQTEKLEVKKGAAQRTFGSKPRTASAPCA